MKEVALEARQKSIVTDAMRRLGIRVGLVIVAVTAITYFHVIGILEQNTLNHLEKYTHERAKYESTIFQFVKDGHAAVKKQLLGRLALLKGTDPRSRFYREVEKFPDGVTRTRLAGFDGQLESFIYIGKNAHINAATRRKVMLFLDMSNQFGPSWNHRLEDFYFTTPDNILVGFWPGFPNWAHAAPADLWMPDEEYVYVADKKHDPERKTVWTGLYYDEPSDVWLVSTETPVDLNGKQIATIGSDITLNRLMDRTINNKIQAGTYNIILRQDGRVIAHPKLIKEIKAKKGHYEVSESNDAHLKSIYQLIKENKTGSAILHNEPFHEYLSAQQLKGPGWYFITVYPESLIEAGAKSTAWVVLGVGALSLLVELLFLFLILKGHVALPLSKLATAVNQVAEGDHDIKLDYKRPDELGRISEAFQQMVNKVDGRTRELEQARNDLEDKVAERTKELEQAQDELIKKERLATLGQLTATVSHELRNPLSSIASSVYILKKQAAGESDTLDKSIERIDRNVKRCDQIIDEMLDFTRTANISLQPIKFDQWLDRVLNEIDLPKGIEVDRQFNTGETRVHIDPDRMRRAIINVVINAWQAMLCPDCEEPNQVIPGAHLQISTTANDERITVKFTDNGCGMDEEVLQKIFEPLYSTKGFGVGLGMPAIQQVMDQHHGGISVTSGKNRGTTVTLWLPRSDERTTT
jgi:signal transduction histidine kinase